MLNEGEKTTLSLRSARFLHVKTAFLPGRLALLHYDDPSVSSGDRTRTAAALALRRRDDLCSGFFTQAAPAQITTGAGSSFGRAAAVVLSPLLRNVIFRP